MNWKPSKEQSRYLNLIISMSTDCLMGKGVDTQETYVTNLKMITDQLTQPGNAPDIQIGPKFECLQCSTLLYCYQISNHKCR